MKGNARPVTATGRLAGPVVTLGDVEKIGIDLETTRRSRGDRPANTTPRCPRAASYSGKDVTISVTLELALADDED